MSVCVYIPTSHFHCLTWLTKSEKQLRNLLSSNENQKSGANCILAEQLKVKEKADGDTRQKQEMFSKCFP